jgi:cytochrome o ubiquinol oxidase operon protein cyoD
MSTDTRAGHGDHGHTEEHAHGTFGSYMTGFLLSVILTAVPFYLVMNGTVENKTVTSLIIMAFAAVQIVVHMIYFLHMSPRSESGWTLMALLFTVVVVVITLSGSLWVMYHLNTNMMLGHDMGNLP